jgi:hypothetical protein
LPTRGAGDAVIVGTARTEVQVLYWDGQPATGAEVLSRDLIATPLSEKWYKTDEKGMAQIELVGDPTVVVVHYGDALASREIRDKNSKIIFRLPK